MAKRPLRAWMRDRLTAHVEGAVQPAAEKKALEAAFKRAAPLVTTIIEKKYPPRDMAVLKKYSVCSQPKEFKLQSTEGSIAVFKFVGDGPLTPQGLGYQPIYLADAKAFTAVEAWRLATEAYDTERKKRNAAFVALIRSAAHVEDVIEIWPEAAKLIPQTEMLAPVAPEQIAIIKADMRERKAA